MLDIIDYTNESLQPYYIDLELRHTEHDKYFICHMKNNMAPCDITNIQVCRRVFTLKVLKISVYLPKKIRRSNAIKCPAVYIV